MIGLIALAAATLSAPERTAVYIAAGAKRRGSGWAICTDDANAVARIDSVSDLNGDGRPEAVVSEDGSYCNGGAETGFALVSKQANGKWRLMVSMSGMPEFMNTKGAGGWPDISVGGPGFCFPVLRWNGRNYVNQRREYDGKPCR